MCVPRRRLARDEEAVSEVIGYIFSFFMSFVLLVASLYTFGLLADAGNQRAAEAEFQDIANRVASGALEVFRLGSSFRTAGTDVQSGNASRLLYTKPLDIPDSFRGYSYKIEMTGRTVYVNSTDGSIKVNSTTFKAEVTLPPAGTCTTGYDICTISGSVLPGTLRAIIQYEYKPANTPPATAQLVNAITLTS
jgi:hypothetical protein